MKQDLLGVSEESFVDKKDGYAIKIKKVKRYCNLKNLREEFNLFLPQSFAYLPK